MQQIRPHAVRLADSWSFPDYLLNRYDHSLEVHLYTFTVLTKLALLGDMMAASTKTSSIERIGLILLTTLHSTLIIGQMKL